MSANYSKLKNWPVLDPGGHNLDLSEKCLRQYLFRFQIFRAFQHRLARLAAVFGLEVSQGALETLPLSMGFC